MNHEIWKNFAEALSDEFAVYTPDLPGFGKSKILSTGFTLDDVADVMLDWMEHHHLPPSIVIGHSMGGYVTLAMVAKQPERFKAFGLFHSTALGDTDERKASRTKVVSFVETNGVEAFTSNFIQPLFADQQHPSIASVREINLQSSKEAVVGYTVAMRDRPERLEVLETFQKPVLFIAGEKDSGIPVPTIREQSSKCKHAVVQILPATGHMGMIEKPGETLTIVRSFCHHAFER